MWGWLSDSLSFLGLSERDQERLLAHIIKYVVSKLEGHVDLVMLASPSDPLEVVDRIVAMETDDEGRVILTPAQRTALGRVLVDPTSGILQRAMAQAQLQLSKGIEGKKDE